MIDGATCCGRRTIPRGDKSVRSCFEESHEMAVFRIALTEDEQRVANVERDSHPEAHVRRKMLVVWLLHCCKRRSRCAALAGVAGTS